MKLFELLKNLKARGLYSFAYVIIYIILLGSSAYITLHIWKVRNDAFDVVKDEKKKKWK